MTGLSSECAGVLYVRKSRRGFRVGNLSNLLPEDGSPLRVGVSSGASNSVQKLLCPLDRVNWKQLGDRLIVHDLHGRGATLCVHSSSHCPVALVYETAGYGMSALYDKDWQINLSNRAWKEQPARRH